MASGKDSTSACQKGGRGATVSNSSSSSTAWWLEIATVNEARTNTNVRISRATGHNGH